MDLIERIFELIKSRKTTAKALADAIGVSPGNITDWKNGRSKPSPDAVNKIASHFNVSTDYLYGRTDNPSTAGETFALLSDIPYDQLTPEDLVELETMKQFIIAHKLYFIYKIISGAS